MERSPADVLRLVVAGAALAAVLLLEQLFGETLDGFAAELLAGLSALPRWITALVVVGTRALAVIMLGGGLLWTLRARSWRMLGTVAVAALVAAPLAALLDPAVGVAEAPPALSVTPQIDWLGDRGFPTLVGLAVVAAVLTAAAPWLSRRWRQLAWVLVGGLVVTRFLTSPASLDPLVATLAGCVAGAGALVALGAPSRRPTKEAILAGMAAVGSPAVQLQVASVDARGSTPYFGLDAGGRRLFVKVLGADERSADLLFRLYRSIRPRNFGDERPFSSLRRGVEHEALLALAAGNVGLRTPALLAFAAVEPNGYALAYEAIEGRSLDRVDAQELTDEVLTEIWGLLAVLRHHRIAHRDLRLANLFLDTGGQAWLIDLGFSELAASDVLLATDAAELLASTCVVVGVDRAVAAAAPRIDSDGLLAAEARLRPWALSGATRTAHKARPGLLDELRRQVRATATSEVEASTTPPAALGLLPGPGPQTLPDRAAPDRRNAMTPSDEGTPSDGRTTP